MEQANVYFERCHAADRDPRRDDLERRACWQAWRDHYEVGQPDDRLDYVRERLVMLDPASGDALTLSAPEATSPDLAGSEMASPDLAGSENVSSTMAGETAADALGTPQAVPPEGPELSDSVSDRPPRARRR
ncbi:MAG: hypothetical protein J0L92_37725, partial [Deltaproteobacteria bacterium]|nr:hypothetical protein [Deltaproteobacteria bacterium]